jgi:hypothetical protein
MSSNFFLGAGGGDVCDGTALAVPLSVVAGRGSCELDTLVIATLPLFVVDDAFSLVLDSFEHPAKKVAMTISVVSDFLFMFVFFFLQVSRNSAYPKRKERDLLTPESQHRDAHT